MSWVNHPNPQNRRVRNMSHRNMPSVVDIVCTQMPCLTFSRRSLPVSTSSRVLCLRLRISHWNARPNPCTWDLRITQNQPIGLNQSAPKVRGKLNLSLSTIEKKTSLQLKLMKNSIFL